MRRGVRTARVGDSLSAAFRVMRDAEIGVLLVVDAAGGQFGVVSKTDLLSHVADHGTLDADVASVATRDVLTVDIDATLAQATQMMAVDGVHHLVVVEEGASVGMLAAWDVVCAAGEGRISLLEGPHRAVGARSGPGV